MRPKLDREVQIGYIAIGAVALLGLIALLLVSDWGELAAEVERRRERYEHETTGPKLLTAQIRELEEANAFLAGRIGGLQERVGIREVPPFFFGDGTKRQDEIFYYLGNLIKTRLRTESEHRGIDFDHQMGFGVLLDRPPARGENVREHLIMLQLVTKAVYLAMHSPNQKVTAISVRPINMRRDVVLGGPKERPTPLLREYRIELTVSGWLQDLLWLKHRLSVDDRPTAEHEQLQEFCGRLAESVRQRFPNEYDAAARSSTVGSEISPLVVTAETLSSENASQYDGAAEMTLTIELAGLEFLDGNVDWDRRIKATGPARPAPARDRPAGAGRPPGTAVPRP